MLVIISFETAYFKIVTSTKRDTVYPWTYPVCLLKQGNWTVVDRAFSFPLGVYSRDSLFIAKITLSTRASTEVSTDKMLNQIKI